MEAWKFCSQNAPEVIDAERQDFLDWLRQLEKELQPRREQWYATEVAELHKRPLAKINVPLIEALQKHFGIQDESLVKHLTAGFPMSGEMPEDIDGAREEE